MKKLAIAVCLILPLLVSGARGSGDRTLDDLREELTALTESITSQTRLLEIYQRLGKAEEVAATRKRVLDLVDAQRELLDALGRAMGEKSGAPRAVARPPVAPRRPARPKVAPPIDVPSVKEAVRRSLDWFARHQHADGYWDSDGFHLVTESEASGPGYALYDPGVTGLALLAFLGAGETHKEGSFKTHVKNGLKHLKQIQDPEGCFGPRTTNHFTYNHAIASLAMIEGYAMTSSPIFLQSAQAGVDFIHKAQNPYLAWRYGVRPGDNDTSVTGWMVAALRSAETAGLRVDRDAFNGARAWIEKVTEPEYGRVGYTFRGSPPARSQDLMDRFPSDKSESLTAEGILIRVHCGEQPGKSEMIQKGADLVLKKLPEWNEASGSIDMYYWYWGTLAMNQVGGAPWKAWKEPMAAVALENQRSEGVNRGSWDPLGAWGRDGGRIYSTALMTLILETVGRGL